MFDAVDRSRVRRKDDTGDRFERRTRLSIRSRNRMGTENMFTSSNVYIARVSTSLLFPPPLPSSVKEGTSNSPTILIAFIITPGRGGGRRRGGGSSASTA